MPEKRTLERARRARKQGKAATTQAGEFVREEMEHAKRGKHPVKGRKQAIAIGLSKARRAGVKVPRRGAKAGAAKAGAAKRGTTKRGTKRGASSRGGTKRTAARGRRTSSRSSRASSGRRSSSRKR